MNSVAYSRLIGVTLIALALLAPVGAARAATTVTNLTLAPHGEFTELAVVGGGSALCNHFTEPATNGRPFRIVLDFCDARHGLTQMTFTNLPATSIARIRTSQFSTSPKNVVRVVLDMKSEVTYSVQPEGANLVVRVVDPGHGSFAVWNANSGVTVAMQSPVETPKPAAKPQTPAPSMTANTPQPAAKTVAKSDAPATPVEKPAAKAAAPVKQTEMAKKVEATPAKQPEVAQKNVATPKTETNAAKVTPPHPMGDESPVVAVQPSTHKDLSLPPVPLVLAPEFLDSPSMASEPSSASASAETPVPIAKVSMKPIGPQPAPAGTGNEMASGNAANKSLWASTTPQNLGETTPPATMAAKTMPKGGEYDEGDAAEYAMADVPADNTPAPPASLLDRLKSKFFGDQSQPRPYETVGDGIPTNEVYGPPSPNATIDREELLARIRAAKERASGRGGPAIGPGGTPARTVLYYDDMDRRDPFAPLVSGQRSGFVTDALPNVETLRLVGILNDDHESLALLENLEGFGYILRVGDDVQNGKMIAIQDRRVLFRIDDYGWTHVVALQLTARGSDPSKSLGAVPQEFPTWDDNDNSGKSGSTGNQGSDEE